MVSASSMRPPYPDDLKIGTYGLTTVDGSMIEVKTQTLENVAPTAQEYDSAPIYKERTFAFKPQRGMGERVQSGQADQRYSYGLNVWVFGGLFGKGPLTHTITPPTTGSITDFVEALNSTSLSQFILAGENVLLRGGDTNGTQTVSETRSTHVATSGVRFLGAYATPIDGLYVAWDDGVLRQYDGSAWNAAVLPSGFLPEFLEVLNSELWAADPTSSVVRKVTGDPLLAASWGGPILVGNPSIRITAIRQVDNQLAIFKADGGVFTLNADGSVNDLFPGLRVAPDNSNGQRVAAWLDALWFRMGASFYQLSLTGGASITPIGPERMLDNSSEVHGPVQAFAGYAAICAFAGIYNGTDSFLLQYGNWLTANATSVFSINATDTYQFVDQYDGAVVKWVGKHITAMRVSGIAAPDTRLYVGFSDGSWDYLKLVPNPLAPGSGAEYTLAASKMYIPRHHAMFQADWKTTNGFTAFGPTLNTTDYVSVAYRTDGSTGAYTSAPANLTAPGQRVDLPNSTVGHDIDVEVTLVNSTTADTPVVEGIAIHESVRPSLKRDFSGSINAIDHAARRDGSTSRLTGDQIRDVVLQAAGAPAAVTLTLPDETVEGLSFFGYKATLLPRTQRNGRGWHIDFQATEFSVNTVTGTVDRFTVPIDDLGALTIDESVAW